ncbi:DAK2 domain-containing protein [Nocardia sp. CA-145437]|uniref:DAK2 domain-containing protein n=1 Tax=Nocardia sp. CA-145437 TaxID=3239980 RepID=UPI003D9880F2
MSGRTVTVPGVADALDGTALLNWGRLTLTALERHRDEINALNVFPVADSDTGTNLLATMRAAVYGAEEAVRAAERAARAIVPAPDRAAEPGEMEESGPAAAAERGRGGNGRLDGDPVAPADRLSGDRGPAARTVAAAMARAATFGARGNSGIILSQVLRGIADAVAEGPLTERALRVALRRAARLVREALSSPVEGTMLTVLERAAERAADATDRDLLAVALAAADGAAKALGETPAQLGVLREAGVVDAGARGLLVLLDELVAAAGGRAPARPIYRRGAPDERPAHRPDERHRRAGGDVAAAAAAPAGFGAEDDADRGIDTHSADSAESGVVSSPRAGAPATAAGDTGISDDEATSSGVAVANSRALGTVSHVAGSGSGLAESGSGSHRPRGAWAAVPHYEVMFLVRETDEPRVGVLRDRLAELGDSVVVVGDGADTWSAHVHCGDAGAAVEAGLVAGALTGIRIEILDDSGHAPRGKADRAILAVASGAGAVRLFEDAGAVVIEGAVTSEELLEAIRRIPHREVLVLPNGALPAHELVAVSVAARDGQREVLMLPCASMVQGLAALSMHDAGRVAADDAFAMSEAAAGTRWGALQVAPERALTMVGMCAAGDGLGLAGHDVVVIDSDVRAAGRTLLDRMLGLGGELVTMLVGGDAPEGLSDDLTAHVAAGFPGVEVVVYPGGQTGDLVQIGVE